VLNPDTLVKPGALETLVCFMEQQPEAGAAGARILNPDESLQTSCYPSPTLSRELWRLFHLDAVWPYGEYRMSRWSVDQPREVDAVLGACVILRRDALDQVRWFDEDYFIYSEEIDLCRRLQEHKWKIYWLPQAKVIHYGGQSTRQVAAGMFLLLYQNKVRYFRKHYGRVTSRLYKLILLAAALVRCLAGPLAWLERPPRREQHLALTRNYMKLIRAIPGF
jgi:GT2 family glycosyltransferase